MKKEESPFDDVSSYDFSHRARKIRSRGFSKMVKTIYAVTQHPRYQKEIRKLRTKYAIPVDGFRFTRKDSVYEVATSYSCSEWKYSKPDSLEEGLRRFEEMKTDLMEVARHANLFYYAFIEALVPFLFFNNITQRQFRALADFHDGSQWDVCSTENLESIYREGKAIGEIEKDSTISAEDKKFMIRENDFWPDMIRQFPIAVAMSRYASLQDVLSFVRNNWAEIKASMVRTAKDDEGTMWARTRTTWDRYDFIWRNREVSPRGKLAEMVNKQFGSRVDAIYVRNVIAREKKRRG